MATARIRVATATLAAACSPAAYTNSTAVVSPHWAGYVATPAAGSFAAFTGVSATWTQPAPVCRRRGDGASADLWVGTGGYDGSTNEVQQIGSLAGCTSRGKVTESAWFALLPYPPHRIPYRVSAGDILTGTVTTQPTAVRLQLLDETAGWSFTRTIDMLRADTTSAEWIVEAPMLCRHSVCRQASLPELGTVAFTNVSAVADGQTGTLANPGWTVTALTSTPVPASAAHSSGATPCTTASDGTSFTVAVDVRIRQLLR